MAMALLEVVLGRLRQEYAERAASRCSSDYERRSSAGAETRYAGIATPWE
jgi:hypothetical protein